MSSWLLEIRTARCCQCCPSPHLLLKFWVCALRSVCQVGCGVESTLPLAPALSLSIPPLSHSLFCPPPPTLLFSFFSFLSKFTWVQTSAGRGSKISITGPGEKKYISHPQKKFHFESWVVCQYTKIKDDYQSKANVSTNKTQNKISSLNNVALFGYWVLRSFTKVLSHSNLFYN